MTNLQITDNHDWKAIEECIQEPSQNTDIGKINSDLERISNVKIGKKLDEYP